MDDLTPKDLYNKFTSKFTDLTGEFDVEKWDDGLAETNRRGWESSYFSYDEVINTTITLSEIGRLSTVIRVLSPEYRRGPTLDIVIDKDPYGNFSVFGKQLPKGQKFIVRGFQAGEGYTLDDIDLLMDDYIDQVRQRIEDL